MRCIDLASKCHVFAVSWKYSLNSTSFLTFANNGTSVKFKRKASMSCWASRGRCQQKHLMGTSVPSSCSVTFGTTQMFLLRHRGFRTRNSEVDKNTNLKNQQRATSEDEISKAVSEIVKNLKLSHKEALSVRFGIQEGLLVENASEKKTKKRNWLLVAEVCLFVVFVIITYQIVMSATQIKKLVSMTSKDFKAEIPDVSFDDVKGINEVKQELLDVVEFLRDPERFTSLGGKLPKGMLLIGPPGTGKTLLARAIAGEAGVPFYYASGSEFDEMFVGVGSSRIRNLFAEARENSPCIIFIDEIDACGSKRTSSPLQPYARQTINQLLQEMDGFELKESVIVLGATNMADVLDKALTRPGRFDTEINVLPPDITGRKEILELYLKKIVHGDDMDLERIACLTGGMTGADLANLANQAALRAAQLEKSYVEMADMEFALDKLRLGPELKSRVRTEAELEDTAFHEAGHALIAFLSPNTMPIYKATIRQRGSALGHVSMIPTREDENSVTRAKLLARIDVAMGGRVAEELMKGRNRVSTGASSDLQAATQHAYQLVCTFGMSESLRFVAYDYENVSPETKCNIEAEVNKILENSYQNAKELIIKHSDEHKLLAKALVRYETLSLEEIKALLTSKSMDAIDKVRSARVKSRTMILTNPKFEDITIGDVMS